MKNIAYRMFGATMRLVVFVFLMTTVLLVAGYIDAPTWLTVTMSGVFGWIGRDAVTKIVEMWRDIKVPPPQGGSP
jgi:hypothetical protein